MQFSPYKGLMASIVAAFALTTSGCISFAAQRTIADLSNPDLEAKRVAIITVGVQQIKKPEVTEKLIKMALKDTNLEVRRLSIEALGNLKPKMTTELNDVYVFGLNDTSVLIRRTTAAALTEMTNYPPMILHGLTKRLVDPDEIVRDFAFSTMERIGRFGVHTLLKRIQEPNVELRLAAITVLGRMGRTAYLAADALQEIETKIDEDPRIRQAATVALKEIKHP